MAGIAAGPIKDPISLTSWTKLSLLAQIIVSVIAIISGTFEIQMLRDFQAGTFDGDLTDAANANDIRQGLVGVLQALLFITSGVLILMWIYRANFNAHRLGGVDMEFSPGWAVGWYFVPFANLWKPYQAMKEIWQVSANPERWEHEDRSWLLPLWWTIWIISNILGNVAFRLMLQDEPNLDQLMAASSVMLVSDVLDIPLAAVFFFLVQKIHRMQLEQAQLQSFS